MLKSTVVIGGLSGCIGGNFRGAHLAVLVVHPTPDAVTITPLDETDLLEFEAVSDALTAAHDQREALIEAEYEEDADRGHWHITATTELVNDHSTYRALTRELESLPKWDDRMSPVPWGWYVEYRGEVYALQVTKLD